MAILQVTLPDALTSALPARASDAGFPSVDAYVESLIEADVAVPVSPELEAELLAGLNGPGPDVVSVDWDAKRRGLAARHGRAELA